ncbi:Recombination endonuclease VII [Mycobacteroides abscessus subsp. massiliense]|nr:hypothetical protein [Mycobacteroides abscessus subsp. massiliense]SKE69183.1 Recombination endonuclease VII [Mycobacteroides abscessus subsp. massiliense]SKH81518.1 Recombination endonuclease VII [Mycobacteroides abscessus subsp. massiliense]SKI34730.1 Recombination endonuclease VII [Mycobacteroides abscessus subsp. massiliense]SKJ35375.1 Recombination endonuclease VII [Mycobacteroides abscessus subsp. massiliense]
MNEDVLASFSPLRQAAIIRQHVVSEARVLDYVAGPFRTQSYRSPLDVRSSVTEEMDRRQDAIDHISDARWHSCGRYKQSRDPDMPQYRANSWRRKVFDRLVDVLGPDCSACHLNVGCRIDHDHFTGIVRGLLCLECNPSIDGCLHAGSADCFAARYLNQPPAQKLGLLYPTGNTITRLDRVRCHVVGFNLFDTESWPSPNPMEWQWDPPTTDTLLGLSSCSSSEFRAEWMTSGR